MGKTLPNPGIYQFLCAGDGKRYIGSAVWLPQRRASHWLKLRRGTHPNKHLQSAFDLYGEQSFSYSILEHVANKADLTALEQRWLDRYKESELFNIREIAQSNLGFKHSAETKEQVSLSLKGRVFSEEHRRNLSIAGKRRAVERGLEMHNPVSVQKIRAKMTGRKKNFTVEDRKRRGARFSEWRTTHPHPQGMQGKTHSLETRAKMALAHAKRNHKRPVV